MIIKESSTLADALRESGILEEEQLREVDGTLRYRFPDPQALAAELVQRGWLTPYQADQLLRGNGRSLVLGQYLLLERLGEGGMGQVFKARHRLMKRVVALKIIRPDWLSHHNAVHRFHREIQAVAQLSHPNMVTAYDADRVGDTHFLVMEYVDGVDLATLVYKAGPLPVAAACEYIRQAALGLQHAFERGLVHRDIKPSNLLLAKQGTGPGIVKILDMGLARLHAGDGEEPAAPTTALTQEGAVMGTADYISPEQATNAHRVDIRADLYSLGCTLYFLLTGHPPFPGGTFMEKLFKHKLETPRPIRDVRPDVPAGLAAVLDRLMAKRPEDRYQTPMELAAALASFCTEAGPPSTSTPQTLQTVCSFQPGTLTPPHGQETQPGGQVPATPPSGLDLAGAHFALLEAPSAAATLKQTDSSPPVVAAWHAPASSPEAAFTQAPQPGSSRTMVQPPTALPARPRGRLMMAGLVVLGVAAAVGAGAGLVVFLRPAPGNAEHAGGNLPNTPAVPMPETGKHTGKAAPVDPSRPPSPEKSPKPEAPPEPAAKPPEPAVKDPPALVGPPPPPRPRLGVLYNLDVRQAVTRAVFSADGSRVLVGVNDTVWLYDLKTIRSDNRPIVPPFRYPFAQVLADRRPLELALSRSGDRVLFGTVDRVIIRGQIAPARPIVALWDVDSGDAPPVLDGKGMDIHCVALSPDGRYALTGDRDRMVYIWDLEKHDRQSQKSLAGHTDAVEAVCFSPDGRRALSGGRDKTICWWDLDERRLLGSFTGHERWVTCVAFAPDSRRVLSGSDDATARVWSLDEPGRPPLVLKGHDGSVRCVAFAPDGRRALTGGDDATLRLWRLEDGAEIARFSHELPVVAVAFSPDGRYALSVGKDNAVWRWELPE